MMRPQKKWLIFQKTISVFTLILLVLNISMFGVFFVVKAVSAVESVEAVITETCPDGLDNDYAGVCDKVDDCLVVTSADSKDTDSDSVDDTCVVPVCDYKIHGKVTAVLDGNILEPLANWTVKLLVPNSNTPFSTTTSDANGDYVFNEVCAGSYHVMEEINDGWYQVTPLGQTKGHDYYLVNTESLVNPYNFENIKHSSSTKQGSGQSVLLVPVKDAPIVLGKAGEPQLIISKKINQAFANPGDDKLEFIITITNAGELAAFNVVLVDALPEGLSYLDEDANTKTMELGDIEAGETKVVTILVSVDADAEISIYTSPVEVVADNHRAVTATVDLDVRVVTVLAATGFRLNEMLALTALTSALWYASWVARKKYHSHF